MELIPTDLNWKLASAVRRAVMAERANIAGRAAFWRLCGLGIGGFGICAAIGLVLLGYSYVYGNRDTLAGLSSALADALSKVELRALATGTVNVEPKEIALAPGQTVLFDSSATVALERGASVRADGEIMVQGASVSTPVSLGQRMPAAPNIINFTVFKALPFQRGTVQTGWMFLTSAQQAPTSQYCYYAEKMDSPGANVMLDIGTDGKFEPPKKVPSDFDLEAAFQKCVWFKGDNQ